jgi:hypothetical protein
MRLAMQELEKLFREIENSRNIKPGTLLEIYKAEGRVVFMGKRRNIISDLRKIVLSALETKSCDEN